MNLSDITSVFGLLKKGASAIGKVTGINVKKCEDTGVRKIVEDTDVLMKAFRKMGAVGLTVVLFFQVNASVNSLKKDVEENAEKNVEQLEQIDEKLDKISDYLRISNQVDRGRDLKSRRSR